MTGVPFCVDCRHAHDERRPLGSGPVILTCNRFRSLADGVTRISCDAVRTPLREKQRAWLEAIVRKLERGR